MQLHFVAVLAVVGVLAVGQVFRHDPQSCCGEGSADEMQHQNAFHLETKAAAAALRITATQTNQRKLVVTTPRK